MLSATLETPAENKMVLKRLYQSDKDGLWPKANMSTDLNGHFGVCLTQVTASHTISILVLIWAHFLAFLVFFWLTLVHLRAGSTESTGVT